MAIVVTGQLQTLAEAQLDKNIAAYKTGTADQQAEYQRLRDALVEKYETDWGYLVSYMEVRGVKSALDTGTRTIETYVLGAGDHGGSLTSATGGPVAGTVKDAKSDTATQSNDGTGRVL